MNENQKAAYVMAQAARVFALVAGMQAENQQRAAEGCAMAYREEDFHRVVDEHGIGHNDVIGFFQS